MFTGFLRRTVNFVYLLISLSTSNTTTKRFTLEFYQVESQALSIGMKVESFIQPEKTFLILFDIYTKSVVSYFKYIKAIIFPG